MSTIPSIANFHQAYQLMKDQPHVIQTRLELSRKLSEKYQCQLYLKREDMQVTRSFKIRGALNQISKIKKEQREKGIVAVTDGNFGYAISYICGQLNLELDLFITKVSSQSKIDQIQHYGKGKVILHQHGDNFEQCHDAYTQYALEHPEKNYVHPFENDHMIEANGTIVIEILNDIKEQTIDYLVVPLGGGGLAAGISSTTSQLSPETKVIAVEPEGAASFTASKKEGKVIRINDINRFCNGSSVGMVGKKCFDIINQTQCQVEVVKEGKVATAILNLYDNGIIVEPSGALSIAVLDGIKEQIKNKVVVCVLTGSNSDLARLDSIRELSLMHEGLKIFFLINFPLRAGILSDFVKNCLTEGDEISHIQFNKKANRETAPALLAIEVSKKENINEIKKKMKDMELEFQIVNDNKELYDLLV